MVDLASFVREYPVLSFVKGQTILSAGESVEYMPVISAGFAKILATDAQGAEQMLWIAGRLDVVPTEQFFRRKTTAMFSRSAVGYDGLQGAKE